MKHYYGTKLVTAKPMSRLEYNIYRGWELPKDENPEDAGYLVEYMDGGAPNHKAHVGYISWSPAAQFEAAYQDMESLSFGHALEALKSGRRVARADWNDKGMWLILISGPDSDPSSAGYMMGWLDSYDVAELLSWIGIRTADSGFGPWLPNQSDMMANDWCVLSL